MRGVYIKNIDAVMVVMRESTSALRCINILISNTCFQRDDHQKNFVHLSAFSEGTFGIKNVKTWHIYNQKLN